MVYTSITGVLGLDIGYEGTGFWVCWIQDTRIWGSGVLWLDTGYRGMGNLVMDTGYEGTGFWGWIQDTRIWGSGCGYEDMVDEGMVLGSGCGYEDMGTSGKDAYKEGRGRGRGESEKYHEKAPFLGSIGNFHAHTAACKYTGTALVYHGVF